MLEFYPTEEEEEEQQLKSVGIVVIERGDDFVATIQTEKETKNQTQGFLRL